jgi:hypothetical protein
VEASAEPEVVTEVVRSPSALREAGWVGFALANIVFWSAAIMGGGKATTDTQAKAVRVDEVAFDKLPTEDQRLFRRCAEGLTEAEDVRNRTKDWPTLDQLAQRKIPPFTPDPVDRGGYTWKLVRDTLVVDYVGTPAPGSGRPNLAIVAVEPDPGMAIDPGAVEDETHHKLADGTMLHVGIFVGGKPLERPAPIPAFEDGWKRITLAPP